MSSHTVISIKGKDEGDNETILVVGDNPDNKNWISIDAVYFYDKVSTPISFPKTFIPELIEALEKLK